MPDGLWTAGGSQSQVLQAQLVRHRLLTINLDGAGALNAQDASSYGSTDPNSISSFISGDRGQEGGEHFVMSPETSDGNPTLGFEFCLSNLGLAFPATAAMGGFTVTVWEMIGNTMFPDGTSPPVWASLGSVSGVGLNELYRSFDVNATVLRFQIENFEIVAPPPSITICFAEL